MVKKITKKDIYELIIQCLLISLGTFITAFGYIVFLSPHKIVPGGFMGLAQIIHDVLLKTGFDLISTSVWYLILNVFLYIYAVKTMGVKFGIRSGVGIATYSIFTSVISNLDFVGKLNEQFISESLVLGGGVYILYAIYGGILMGAGIGLVFRGEGSTGGCDMVAVVVNKFFPMITTGQVIMTVDGFVVLASLISYGSLLLPLYALITIFVCSKVADIFVNGIKSLHAYYILTDKSEEMSHRIMHELKRGVTNIKCEGMYTRNEKDMLFIVLRRFQIMQLKKIVKEVDINSFMFSCSVKDISGKGFYEMTADSKKNRFSFFNKKSNTAIIEDGNEEKSQNELRNDENILNNNEKLTQNVILEENIDLNNEE